MDSEFVKRQEVGVLRRSWYPALPDLDKSDPYVFLGVRGVGVRWITRPRSERKPGVDGRRGDGDDGGEVRTGSIRSMGGPARVYEGVL